MTTSYFNFQSYNNPHLDEWGLLFTLWLIGNVRNYFCATIGNLKRAL